MATTVNIPIVPPGTDMKFRIAVVKEGFSLAENDFYIVIKNRWGRVVARVQKSDCYIDNEWRWDFKDWIFGTPAESVDPVWIGDQERRLG